MVAVAQQLVRIPRRILMLLIRAYQVMASPFPSPCRFYPTCSMYGLEALERYGAVKGSWLTVKRLLRCHPFAKSGVDPVP